jgi:hypothetical protein
MPSCFFPSKFGKNIAATQLFAFNQSQRHNSDINIPLAGLPKEAYLEQKWIPVLWNAGVSPWKRWTMPNSRGIMFGKLSHPQFLC